MFNIFKSSKTAVIAAVIGAGMSLSSAAHAITMTFDAAALSDGGIISGTFDYVGGAVSGLTVTTSAGSQVTFAQTYTTGTQTAADTISFAGTSTSGGTAQLVILLSGATFADLEAQTITSATISPSSAPFFSPSNEFVGTGSGSQLRGVTGGVITVPAPAPIPLPAGAPLLIAGLGGLAFLRKKRNS